MANTLARLGTKLSWVVNGSENIDEISLHDKTNVFEVRDNSVENFEITLGDFGIFETAESITAIRSPAESASLVRNILQNNARDESSETLVAINAAAAIHLLGAAPSLREGFEMAIASIRYGDAMNKLTLLTDASRR
jgi:anthranilate phosphoribosyltransferase